VLQRLEGCRDREACDRFAYDLRWRYVAGVDDEMSSFAQTVLVELHTRLRASGDPARVGHGPSTPTARSSPRRK
jgi:hypothetical protein